MNAFKTALISAFLKLALISSVSACGTIFPDSISKEKNLRDQAIARGSADQSDDLLDEEKWKEKQTSLREGAAKLALKVNETNTLLSKVFEVKSALCLRQAELFSQCIVHAPLSPSLWRTSAACRQDQRTWDKRTFKVSLTGTSGRYKLVLDQFIESNVFDSERETNLTWVSTGHRSMKDLKLSDVSSMRLHIVDGKIPDLSASKFKFKVDDSQLLSEEDFLNSTRTDTSISISPLPLFDVLQTRECFVADNELDALSKDATMKAPLPTPYEPIAEKPNISQRETIHLYEEWMNSSERILHSRTDAFLATAQEISRLRRDLRGDLQLGCWSRQPVRNIEMSINGEHLPLSDWDRNATGVQHPNTGHPRQVTIDFGGGLRFTNSDENLFPLFRENGRWNVSSTGDLTIGDLIFVALRKEGVAWEHFKRCWSTWGGLGKSCEWQNRESDRYLLRGLKIKINGQTFYERNNIDHRLQKDTLNWIDEQITANPAYIELMRRRDCPSPGSSG